MPLLITSCHVTCHYWYFEPQRNLLGWQSETPFAATLRLATHDQPGIDPACAFIVPSRMRRNGTGISGPVRTRAETMPD